MSDSFLTLIEQHPTDVCATIADAVLAPLATLALNQQARNGEAVEAAMKLFEALFHGSPQSQKYVTQAFFLKTAPTRPTEDEQRLEASAQCLKMLSNPLEALTAAKTFNTQLCVSCVTASRKQIFAMFIRQKRKKTLYSTPCCTQDGT